MKKILITLVILIIVVIGARWIFYLSKTPGLNDVKDLIGKSNLIKVTNIESNQEIESPLLIKGKARGNWFFEASFPIKLFDENNNLLATGTSQAQSDWMTDNLVPFKAILIFSTSTAKTGKLVLEKSNPSGLPENNDSITIPIVFKNAIVGAKTKINVYFNNGELDPEFSCSKVFAAVREVILMSGLEIERIALEELLKGVTDSEKTQGFVTSINPNVKIQKFIIENNIAKVDFDKQLEFQVGGSCRIAAIRTQITETLEQFPNIQDVIISIDDRTEDILQP